MLSQPDAPRVAHPPERCQQNGFYLPLPPALDSRPMQADEGLSSVSAESIPKHLLVNSALAASVTDASMVNEALRWLPSSSLTLAGVLTVFITSIALIVRHTKAHKEERIVRRFGYVNGYEQFNAMLRLLSTIDNQYLQEIVPELERLKELNSMATAVQEGVPITTFIPETHSLKTYRRSDHAALMTRSHDKMNSLTRHIVQRVAARPAQLFIKVLQYDRDALYFIKGGPDHFVEIIRGVTAKSNDADLFRQFFIKRNLSLYFDSQLPQIGRLAEQLFPHDEAVKKRSAFVGQWAAYNTGHYLNCHAHNYQHYFDVVWTRYLEGMPFSFEAKMFDKEQTLYLTWADGEQRVVNQPKSMIAVSLVSGGKTLGVWHVERFPGAKEDLNLPPPEATQLIRARLSRY